ncbi:MAG TPA: hypothetical protein VMN38_08545 [Sphingomicrobium sp.]|nr:hypothetical protein [Sphingomicrobium sp.]
MPTQNKPRLSKSDKLAHYLAGKGPLPHEFFSMGNLTEALRKLMGDRDICEDEIEARVKSFIRSHHGLFEQLNIVKRALKVRTPGEPLFFALARVRQAYARRAFPRRKR